MDDYRAAAGKLSKMIELNLEWEAASGVTNASVNLMTRSAYVAFDPARVSAEALVETSISRPTPETIPSVTEFSKP